MGSEVQDKQEIEITPEMVREGVAQFDTWDWESDPRELLVENIFRVGMKLQRSPDQLKSQGV